MFLGHFAVALGAKKAAPRVSLGALLLGAQLADILRDEIQQPAGR